ncbi:lipase family protein [Amycolatopsis acidiphila]|uniref:Prolyl oligopeptidase family serine peptidase n=1 Tax=Amycolatopsis acidiphila TaxID=715473 RepID=A0A558AGW0_9PSEU|nr:lipase family protein [Amycolatopsis acidiphila]TVT23497.1 prolyl oligopeptidase family serine peptidase [Amycolatopsis acidiphila]UIJ59956.1 lipase family protein [Amycolatopsis acidiphila]GHG62215.1 lipase [Amycolatopsis acidiphila]
MRLTTRRRFLAVLTTVIGLVSLTVGAAPAGAADFYDPPSPLPAGAAGDIIRHQASQFFLDPTKLLPAPAKVQRIMYRSTDTHGDPVAVTGTVLTPTLPWTGPGARPIISYAAGTQGLGDQCAPSKALATGGEYEGPFISGLLSRGYAVVITDYEGLGTPGVHTYVNRKAEGYAVLDAIRAAQRLPEAGLPDDGPVAISGYSQGGGASAAAAELQPGYAPELKLKGAYAGAVPADLGAVAANLDGHYAVGFLMFAVASMNYAYPQLDIPDMLNAKGRALQAEVENECTGDAILKHAFTRTADLTTDGRPITAYLSEAPFASVVAEQQIGLTPPAAPVLVAHSALDDIVPFEQGRTMARNWCAEGATVQFDTLAVPTHVGGAVAAYPDAFAWLDGRLHGVPAPDNCGGF